MERILTQREVRKEKRKRVKRMDIYSESEKKRNRNKKNTEAGK